MYVTLFSITLVIGLLLLLLPINIYKKWFDNRVFPIVIRVIGIILCIISVFSICLCFEGRQSKFSEKYCTIRAICFVTKKFGMATL